MWVKRRSPVLLFAMCFGIMLTGCVTTQPSPGSENVRIVTNHDTVRACQNVSHSLLSWDHQIEAPGNVLNRLRNDVVSSGGDTLYLPSHTEQQIRNPRGFEVYEGVGFNCSANAVAEKSEWERLAEIPITCSTSSECELQWSRAIEWLQNNSEWKFRNVADNLVTTEGPMDTPKPAYEITKVPTGQEGVYAIRLRTWCGAEYCTPSILRQKASFFQFVEGD